jgi:hypothetical protein
MTTVALAGVVVLVLAVVHVPIGDYLARVFTDTWWWRVERASTGWCECPQRLHPSPQAPPHGNNINAGSPAPNLRG